MAHMLVGLQSDKWSQQLTYNCVLENWEKVLEQTEDNAQRLPPSTRVQKQL